jgi:ubiquinone/menaquinone biosynthesis C-methylase UbiE
MTSNTTSIHGHATAEQHRLVEQAQHWRDDLILPGTTLAPGTRLLDVGCGVGAVLAILGEAFPGIALTGVDHEPAQIAYARGHLAAQGLRAALCVADAEVLPFPDGSYDHVWMMWLLEHVADPVAVLRESWRVLAPGGAITLIETHCGALRVGASTPRVEALIAAMATGRSEAGPQCARWLTEAGFEDVDPGMTVRSYRGASAAPHFAYVADVLECAIPALAELPDARASQAELELGLCDLRRLGAGPEAELEYTMYKARGRRG